MDLSDFCSVPDLLRRSAQHGPRRIAIDFLGRRLRYDKLDKLVDRAAAGLQRLGLASGERVGLCLPNTPYFVICYFAIMRAGGIVVNFNPLYTERELRAQILDSGATMMIVPDLVAIQGKVAAVAASTGLRHVVLCSMSRAMPLLKSVAFRVTRRREIVPSLPADGLHLSFRSLVRERGSLREAVIDPAQDVALLQYTGGTTGIPKAVALTHANLTANAWQAVDRFGVSADEQERILGVLPLFHVFALTCVLNFGVAVGAEMVLLPRFSVKSALAAIARRRPTVLPAVPTIYNALSDAAEVAPKGADPRIRAALRGIRFCISGGAPLPAEVKARFEQLTGCHVSEGYGLSETSPVVSCNQANDETAPGSVGRPLLRTVVEIRDLADPTIVLGAYERGEVCVRGPQVMRGYWNQPQATADAMIDGAVRTGDVGYLDAGGFLFLVDRIKDLILCGGYNVYPRAIEEALYRHPDVHEATVIGIPDSYRGESPKAFVVLHEGAAADVATLHRFLEGELSRIEMPREIELRASLPRTVIGKLSKKELAAEEAVRRVHAA